LPNTFGGARLNERYELSFAREKSEPLRGAGKDSRPKGAGPGARGRSAPLGSVSGRAGAAPQTNPGATLALLSSYPGENSSASPRLRAGSAEEAAVIPLGVPPRLNLRRHPGVSFMVCKGQGPTESPFPSLPSPPLPAPRQPGPLTAALRPTGGNERPLTSGDCGLCSVRPSFPPPPRRQSADRKEPRAANQQPAD